jgi:thioesterase domain-containing protein
MRTGEQPDSNLIPIRTSGSRPPLFWVHGDASDRLLAGALGSEQPVYAFKHQGRHGERIRYREVETIAAHYLSQVLEVQPAGPYFFGGYSFGGTIAFEMARQIRARNQTAALLFIIDSLSPGTRTHDRVSVSIGSTSADRSLDTPASSVQHHFSELSRLGFTARVSYVLTRVAGKWTEVTTRASKSLYGVLLPVFLATRRKVPFPLRSTYILHVYFNAIARYAPTPYAGRAVYIKSEQRERLHVQRWKTLITGGVEVHEVTGCDHREIIDDAHAPVWLGILKASLQQSAARSARTRTPDNRP